MIPPDHLERTSETVFPKFLEYVEASPRAFNPIVDECSCEYVEKSCKIANYWRGNEKITFRFMSGTLSTAFGQPSIMNSVGQPEKARRLIVLQTYKQLYF